MKFIQSLIASLESKQSHVCVGLDSRYDRIPDFIKKSATVSQAVFSFNKHVIEVTQDIAVAYKMNLAFYGGFGAEGLEGLRLTNEYLQKTYPEIPRFADYKRAEIGSAVDLLAKEVFDWLGFTCMMVTPWFGMDTITDLLRDSTHGVCVYVHDSNTTAAEFQDISVHMKQKMYEIVAKEIVSQWNTSGNIIVEAGATYPDALKRVRAIVGDTMPILSSGVGLQGGAIDGFSGVFGKNNHRLLVNSSRGIIFAGEGQKDYFEGVRNAARALKRTLQEIEKRQ
jgi:orotidine-5'-phosphate decarboxylase